MSAYVIRRNKDGAYVARPGAARSYTKILEDARGYDTLEDAQRDKCGNESVIPLAYVGPFRRSP
jgi:hypothetical protein